MTLEIVGNDRAQALVSGLEKVAGIEVPNDNRLRLLSEISGSPIIDRKKFVHPLSGKRIVLPSTSGHDHLYVTKLLNNSDKSHGDIPGHERIFIAVQVAMRAVHLEADSTRPFATALLRDEEMLGVLEDSKDPYSILCRRALYKRIGDNTYLLRGPVLYVPGADDVVVKNWARRHTKCWKTNGVRERIEVEDYERVDH